MTTVVLYDGTTTLTLNALSVRGFDDPDEVRLVGVQNRYLDGTVEEQFVGFQRVITVDLGVVSSRTNREYLLTWMLEDSNRQIRLSTDFANVYLVEPDRQSNEWLADLESGKRYVLRLVDKYVYTQWPENPLEADSLAYIKNKVAVTGTQASPETFTTGSGKLATDQTGAAYPTFNDATHVFTVLCNSAPYQERHVNVIAAPTVSSGNLTFQLALADVGRDSSDGSSYTDIIILAQAKT